MLTKNQVNDLCNYLTKHDALNNCDNTLKITRDWIKEKGLSEQETDIINFIEKHGGYCDCEVLFNVPYSIH